MHAIVQRLVRFLLPAPRAPLDYPFVPGDVARLHQLRCDAHATPLDQHTWNDLLLDDYLAHLSPGTSIVGQQALYQRLRDGASAAQRAQSAARVRALAAQEERMAQLAAVCAPLREADREVAALIYDERTVDASVAALPAWAGLAWLPALALPCAVAAVFLNPAWFVLLLAIVVMLLGAQVKYFSKAEEFALNARSLQTVLVAAIRADAAGESGFREVAAGAGRVSRKLVRSPWSTVLPFVRDYQDWFMLTNVRHYFAALKLLRQQRALLRECYQLCADLDADLALARHLRAAPQWCWAEHGDARTLTLAGAVHPLLPRAEPLSLAMDHRGAFITGQNGSGKSTLLRTVGLNVAVARAFGFCYAVQGSLPDLPVFTSMQAEDALLGGESLFVAELRRARELLAAACSGGGAIIVVDEIFRGTNYVESVSATAALLEQLARHALVLASSHNVVLARLLRDGFTALCVSRTNGGPLTLAPGVLTQTNAIALLAQHGMEGAVHQRALQVFDWLSAQEGVAG